VQLRVPAADSRPPGRSSRPGVAVSLMRSPRMPRSGSSPRGVRSYGDDGSSRIEPGISRSPRGFASMAIRCASSPSRPSICPLDDRNRVPADPTHRNPRTDAGKGIARFFRGSQPRRDRDCVVAGESPADEEQRSVEPCTLRNTRDTTSARDSTGDCEAESRSQPSSRRNGYSEGSQR